MGTCLGNTNGIQANNDEPIKHRVVEGIGLGATQHS